MASVVWYPLGAEAGDGSVGSGVVQEVLRSHQAASVTVHDYDDFGLDWSVGLAGVELDRVQTSLGEFVSVGCPGSTPSGDLGQPELPVIRRLFLAPPGAEVSFKVKKAPATEVDLTSFENGGALVPMQPRPPATEGVVSAMPFEYDRSVYAKDTWLFDESVVMVEFGLMRGHRLFSIEVRPVSYNPARGLLRATPRLDISIRFEGGQPGGKYPGVLYRMSDVLLNPPDSQKDTRGTGNYLIISAPDFSGTAPLLQFASAKMTQGFDVTTYIPPVGSSSDSIKAYILGLVGTANEPDYILLIGDTLNTGGTCSTFVIPSRIGGGSKTAVTDNYYACLDGGDDWIPDCSIGRFSVRTIAELQNIVDKTLHVADGVFADPGYVGRATFMAGTDLESDGEAVQNFVINSYMTPSHMESAMLYTISYGATTQDVTDAFNAGCSTAGYFGHSDVQFWTNGPYFHNDNIDALVNAGKYPFVFSISCSSSLFFRDWEGYEPCLNEKWIRVADKGAVATLGSTTNLVPHSWAHYADFYNSVWASLYEDGVVEIGEAILAAELDMVAIYGTSDPFSRDVNEMWLLMGDPSLELPMPPQENYLIVTAEDYTESTPLANFISAKESAGFNVMVYEAPAGTTNTTIKSYIQSLWGTNDEPAYVLIVGDTDNNSTATSSTIPYWDGGGTKGSPTDLPYVCVRGSGVSWYPDIPIGRFSVENTTHLESIVNKTLTVESGVFPDPDYVRRGAFLANSDTYGVAEATHDLMIDKYFTSSGLTGTKIYAAQSGGTTEVRNAVNAGSLFTVYMGHSSSSGWWDPSFDQGDVNSLTNTGMYGLVFGWSCNTANYPNGECFGETWLRAPNKGAAAYISASDYIYWGSYEQWEMSGAHEAAFFDAIFGDGIREIGAAWQAGLYRFLKDYGDWDGDLSHEPTAHLDICRNFLEEFLVLGDPSLRLPETNAFSVEVTPDPQSLCCPPSTQVQYTVNVGEIGTWADSVQLTVQGAPAGAPIGFSQNGLAPPFTSILTISGLDAGDVGDYNINVRGTSDSTIRTDIAALHISTALPDSPNLTSPLNGAVDISRSPDFSWGAVSGAVEYDLEVATDGSFSDVVYSVTIPEANHLLPFMLDSFTEYAWHVRAVNGCGDGFYSSTFTFTTLDQADYFTEDFQSGDSCDLENYSIILTPDGSGSYYDFCGYAISELPVDTEGGLGTPLSIGEDGWDTVSLGGSDRVRLYGVEYATLYVNDNGNITFTGGDGDWTPSLSEHFSMPRVAPAYRDFTVMNGDSVRWRKESGDDFVAITYKNVPTYGTSNSNTFQVVMFFDGVIQISWLGLATSDPMTGISAGTGVPVDFTETDLSIAKSCFTWGACCIDDVCSVLTEAECTASSGEYQGDDVTCDPDPCAAYESGCLIISEVVQGKASGDCPRWIEITNTATTDFVFFEGGVIVQAADSNDQIVDIDLSGVVIPAGQSFVINSNVGGVCTGAFPGIYGFAADLYVQTAFGEGNERYILTDMADGSHLLDIYGEFGVNGTGTVWEYTAGYSYRLSEWTSGAGQHFEADEWYFGGAGSLDGPNGTLLLQTLTTPGTHGYHKDGCVDSETEPNADLNCDGYVDVEDASCLVQGLLGGQAGWRAHLDAVYPFEDRCLHQRWHLRADFSGDGEVDGDDIGIFIGELIGS